MPGRASKFCRSASLCPVAKPLNVSKPLQPHHYISADSVTFVAIDVHALPTLAAGYKNDRRRWHQDAQSRLIEGSFLSPLTTIHCTHTNAHTYKLINYVIQVVAEQQQKPKDTQMLTCAQTHTHLHVQWITHSGLLHTTHVCKNKEIWFLHVHVHPQL